jgi:hypothetical protein
MRRLLAVVRENQTVRETVFQLTYFIEMNGYLMLGIVALSVSMSLWCLLTFTYSDGFAMMRFWPDLLMVVFNFGVFLLWILMIMIIYPRYYITGLIDNNALSTGALTRLSTSVDRNGQKKYSNNSKKSVNRPSRKLSLSNHNSQSVATFVSRSNIGRRNSQPSMTLVTSPTLPYFSKPVYGDRISTRLSFSSVEEYPFRDERSHRSVTFA